MYLFVFSFKRLSVYRCIRLPVSANLNEIRTKSGMTFVQQKRAGGCCALCFAAVHCTRGSFVCAGHVLSVNGVSRTHALAANNGASGGVVPRAMLHPLFKTEHHVNNRTNETLTTKVCLCPKQFLNLRPCL